MEPSRDKTGAIRIVTEWKRRLLAMAEKPPYVFVDTPQYLIDDYQRKQTTFIGYTEREVANCEAELGVTFPLVFRQYLLEMGKSPGDLFVGSDRAGIDEFDEFRAFATGLLAETDARLSLPPHAVVFLSHQGYTFLYIIAEAGFDGPVMQWNETHTTPRLAAPTFERLVDGELRLAEKVNKEARDTGGYCMTLHPRGGYSQWRPRPDRGQRPV